MRKVVCGGAPLKRVAVPFRPMGGSMKIPFGATTKSTRFTESGQLISGVWAILAPFGAITEERTSGDRC
ncbi:hypothetical protein NPIL_458331 [Nephila pilipes]|uniref:Uncharacterized protein n=1 Tax=Nephila pilipes TaxID=299642 RepID=A0A8X6R2F0_NEPPI|nr:hypothetical protein NPIL_458331 [Nephila pilipes]